jgi:hypothetical protein
VQSQTGSGTEIAVSMIISFHSAHVPPSSFDDACPSSLTSLSP